VGANVKDIKAGDRVGVGAQARGCMRDDCAECTSGQYNYCAKGRVDTYGSVYPDGEGKSYGGYADYNRTDGRFVVKIPDGISSEHAAPMLCGGVTVYAPLKANGCGPGKSVGVIGVGGLGHFAVMFAKAMGADHVVGISRRDAKLDEVLAMGADGYIATEDDEDWARHNARTLDLIVCTVSHTGMPLDRYLSLLRPGGTLVNVGIPEGGALPNVSAFVLIAGKVKLGGSLVGSPAEIREMLEFAVEHDVKPIIQTWPMRDANQAVLDMEAGKARYRYVLVNEKHL
jgi:D-arabinose 1-dehydrogenase-like Zn-dependent alcohol dehydrogenase